ncbi:protein abrupt isoform X3 [Anastrepha ludens]|nr:protein abrupt isoform X3 [Anastrepha ludens]
MCSVSPNLIPMEQKQEISLPEKLTIHQQHHQQYALKWSDFHSSILNCFQRLRDEEDFVDVTLSCDQRSFNAHRVVLSACSPYFRKLLKSNPCKHPIVILRDVHSENMECLLSFMYNGEVNVRHDQLPDFLKTAHLLQIRGLTDVSESWHSSGFISSEKKPIDTSLDTKCKRDFDKDICEVNSAEKCSFFPNSKPTSERPIASTMVTNYSSSTSNNTPLMKESKTSATACLQWDNTDVIRSRKNHLTPPPQKRIKSADLFRAQHGIGSERALSEREFPAIVQHSFTRDRKHFISDCDQSIGTNENNMEPSMNEEKTLQNQHIDIESMGDESADDKSNSSDEETLERIDRHPEINDSMDPPRPATHNTFLRVPKTLEQHPILNLNDFAHPGEISSKLKTSHPYSTILCNSFWNTKYEDIPGKENGYSSSSGDQNNLSIDSFVAKSTALSLMVKTARLKNKPTIFQEMVIKEEHQQHRHNSQLEHNDPKPRYPRFHQEEQQQYNNRYEKQLPLYEYLCGLQKAATKHQNTLDTNLMAKTFAFSDDTNLPETPTSVSNDHEITYSTNNSYVLPCPLCKTPLEQELFRQHLDGHYPRDSPICPVIECGRRFAHPNSVRNHMRIKHTQQWAKMKVMRSSAGPLPSGLDLKKK